MKSTGRISSPGGVREPAVAGLFYPDDPETLRQSLAGHLTAARTAEIVPKALVAPHAGYVYSGPVAASAYVLLEPVCDRIRRVVLLGPSHRIPFRGIALSSAEAFRTPLGDVPVDKEAAAIVATMPGVQVLDEAHALEHSLEVHLPFLQAVLNDFTLLPLTVGEATPEEVSAVLEAVWGGDETLVVISSDLSHYHGYEEAERLDEEVTRAVLALDAGFIDPEHACGCRPLNGLLTLASRKGLTAEVLDQRNSGDTAGDRLRVVGYAAYSFS